MNEWLGLIILAVVLLIVLGAAGFLAVGLFQARSLIRREFTAYFLSPIAYVVMFVFLLATGFLFSNTLDQLTASGPQGVEFPLRAVIGDQWIFWLVFLVIPPLLTMRLFAEERGTGTLEMLMTSPLRDWQLVLSKYVACFGFYVVMWLPTLLYVPILVDAGRPVFDFQTAWTAWSITLVVGLALLLLAVFQTVVPGGTDVRLVGVGALVLGLIATGVGAWGHYTRDAVHILEWPARIASGPMPVVATYLGLMLAGAMFLALGLFISSLVRNQLVAALLSLALSLVFIVLGFQQTDLDPTDALDRARLYISVPLHFSRDFTRGVIDTRHIILYLSVAVFALFLTVRTLEGRRYGAKP
ncbi:MAG: ABC transporter permease [Planctomycetia bacterium]|nr:ABC transporter permease [Planctomycetia bacterium]